MSILVFEYPLWLLPFCFLVGAFVAWLLYFSKRASCDLIGWQKKTVAVLRFLSVSMLCALLLSPFIQNNNPTLQKPIVVLAQDASESVLLNGDSLFYKQRFISRFDSLARNLSDDYEVVKYNFGQSVKTGFDGSYSQSLTDYSSLFSYLQHAYFGRNLGAVVVASDGIATTGDSPSFAAQQSEIHCPVYALALGDTVPARDVVLQQVSYNKITFQGANYPLELAIHAEGFAGKSLAVKVTDQANTVIATENIALKSAHSFEKRTITLLAKDPGLYHYKVEILPLDGELSVKNNVKDIAFEVLKSKQKIVIVYAAPHPDVAALTKALKSNQNYSVVSCAIQEYKDQLLDCNLAILHQLPSQQQAATVLLNQITQQSIPTIFIVGSSTDFAKFNSLGRGVTISAGSKMFDEVLADYRSDFDLFSLDPEIQQFLQGSPPLIAPFGDYRVDATAKQLAMQRVGSTTTTRPLAVFVSSGEQKTAVLTAEGWWRWRVYNYLHNNNTELFDGFINKIATFMAVKDKKSRFTVQNEAIYRENESIVITAERYNQSYELVNDAEVSCVVTNQQNKNMQYQFSKTTHSYALTLGYLPVGDYTFVAKTLVDGKGQTVNGRFSVVAVQAEVENTQANHPALAALSKSCGGELFLPSQTADLEKAIRANNDIVTVSYENKSMIELVHTVAMFVIFIVLFAAEWFLRKYWGQF